MEKLADQYYYSITMNTPAGLRYGDLTLNIKQENISGYLDILNHKNRVSGKLLRHGQCELTGVIVSLMRKFKYTAVGKFDSYSIQLILKEQNNCYQLYGTAKTGGKNELY